MADAEASGDEPTPRPATDFAAEPPRSYWIWCLGAIAALVVHGALAVAVIDRAAATDTDASDGAQAIDIGLIMTAPHAEDDRPPGALAEDVAASQASPDAQAKPEPIDLPKDKPTETDDPDRLVAQNSVNKPDAPPKPQTVQTTASEQSMASVAAAPPPSDVAREAPSSVAPSRGEGDSARRVVTTWQRRLVAYLDRHKRYPKGAPRDAKITVDFSIDRLGHVLTARITKPSGDPAFDAAALAMLYRADPLPAPPAVLADEGLSFSVPVVFTAKRR